MATTTPLQSEWLLEALRFSLGSTSTSPSRISSAETGSPIERDPRFRKLVEGVLFSRRFILTYQLALLCFITTVGIIHWGKKCLRWSRRRSKSRNLHERNQISPGDDAATTAHYDYKSVLEDVGTPSSSSSPSSQSLVLPPDFKNVDENTLLLRTKLQSTLPWPSRMIRAFLMYQPGPITILQTALPPNGITLVVLLAAFTNLFYAFFRTSFRFDELFILGDRCGLLFVSNLPLLYLLAAKTQPLKFITGYSYESLNIFHRRLGEVMCVVALVHGVCMFSVWYALLRSSGYTLFHYLSRKIVLTGLGALVAFESLYFSSLAPIRRACYEIFLGIHVTLQISALVLLFLHHRNCRYYVAMAVCVFLVDRIICRLILKSTTSTATLRVMEDESTVRVSVLIRLRDRNCFSSTLGGSIARGWAKGDHVFLSIPSLARKHVFQAHPFSVISSVTPGETEEAQLELLIRARDGFSADLLKEALKRDSLTVRIDGPYGSSQARDLLEDADLALLVAGGSGIAVVWPLLHFLLERNRSGDSESLLAGYWQRIILIWVIHKSSHIAWIGRSALRAVESLGVDVIVPEATERVGRPDIEGLVQDTVGKYKDAHRIGVLVSGPDGMNHAVRNKCSELVAKGFDIGIATEKFGW